VSASAIWHEVECGAYDADLPLWEELAESASPPVLDLGCGAGRVALHLTRRGHRVLGVDTDPELAERAQAHGVEAEVGDARALDLGTRFGLVLAPMQLIQLLAGREERLRCLGSIAGHLLFNGLAALAIVEAMPAPAEGALPPPDTREADGWVYSSLPVEAVFDGDLIRVRRLRQTVSPAGELEEEIDETVLSALDAPTLESEAREAGLAPAGRRSVPPTEAHVGSTVVLLEKEAV
jgi:SAM-dependent methyltransferase